MPTLRTVLLASLMLLSTSLANEIVVEELIFQIEPETVDRFIEQDAAIWTEALSSQPGFLKKEVWHDRKKPDLVKLLIHWETMGHWNRVPKQLLAETDKQFRKAMGDSAYEMVSSKAYDWKGETLSAPASVAAFPEFDLVSIDASAWKEHAVEINVPHDEVYHQAKSYRAYPLNVILEKWLVGENYPSEDWELVFECQDGYAPTTSLTRARSGDAYLAFADVDTPDGAAWTPTTKGNGDRITFAPFYGVWTTADRTEAKKGPWPYNLVKLRLVPSAARYQDIKPKDAEHLPGFQLFREHCLRCHALKSIGGTMGPELHTPRNITEYWKQDQLAEFIKSPQAFRTGSKMPPMAFLGDAKIASIVGYLEALAKQR